MKSLLSVRLGAQEPTVLHQPPDVVSLAAAEEAIELADAYGVCDGHPLAESQKITLRNACGEREDGSWAATRVGDFGPRQGTGKNDKIAARELAGLILFGEKLIIHTAHEFPTANESFLRLVSVFENWDDLRKKVARIRYANGEQGIELLSGQRLKYRARTGGSGRGFAKADLVVYDEAQHLSREHVAASGPAKMANPNSQTWYAGSGGMSTSIVAWGMRRQALLGTGGRLAYTEMTGEKVSVVDGTVRSVAPDPTDRDVWYQCIPGLGRWVTEEAVEALYDELREAFPREILCVWDPDPTAAAESVFPPGTWASAVGEHPQPTSGLVFSLDVNPDRTSSAVGVGGDGDVVGLLRAGPGVGWAVDETIRVCRAHNAPAAVAANGAAAALIPDLERAGVTVLAMPVTKVRDACGAFYDAVIEGRIRIGAAPELEAAVRAAVKRNSGDAWVWDRRTGDVSPLVAVTLAFYQLGGAGPSVYEERGALVLG
jgi:hypothetical protein